MYRKFSKESFSRKLFIILNYTFCILLACLCFFPIMHILALSLSDDTAVSSGQVMLLPVNFTIEAYKYVMKDPVFFKAMSKSLLRVILGVGFGVFMSVLAGYPLSKTTRQFHARQYYVWFFMITMVLGGGLIPTYLVVAKLGLINTIWALILPGAVNTFNIILLQNYIKSLPDEIMESAYVDGAGHWCNLFKIVLPLSKPVLATLVLFTAVNHWNAWFDGMIYFNKIEDYPLQSYLRTVVVEIDMSLVTNPEDVLTGVTQKSNRSAQIFIAMAPILCVYPFLQKHFAGGIVMGSVKG